MDLQHSRKFKDLCIDFCNLWSKWCLVNSQGLGIVESIANKQILLLDPGASSQVDYDFDEDRVKFDMQILCKKLADLVDEFRRIASRCHDFHRNFSALFDIIAESSNDCTGLLKTWTFGHVTDVVKKAHENFDSESECKAAILKTLPFAESRAVIGCCTAAWMHQPFIDENLHVQIDALTHEASL